MNEREYPALHRRALGLSRVIVTKIETYQKDRIYNVPLSELKYILSRLETMLRDDEKDCALSGSGVPGSSSGQELNTQCEFFDWNANNIRCAIGCDMYHCNRNCCYATNMPNPTPPYCTKYMKGRL